MMTSAQTLKTPRAPWPWCARAALAFVLGVFALAARAEDAPSYITPDLLALSRLGKAPLPQPPSWVGGPKAAIWSVDDIAAEFSKVTDKPPKINYCRDSFVRPDHGWLIAYRGWFADMLKALKLEYKDQAFNCDKFSRTFVAFADMIALRGGEARGSICVAWATVANNKAFGGVPGSTLGLHALVLVGTSEGLFVLEPQTGEMAPLRSYPNRDGFQDVNF